MPHIDPTLPIADVMPDILASLASHTRLVLEAPPGAGKTTQVPLALLDAAWLEGRQIVMLEPRRVAARAAASFMAKQLGEVPGDRVGYQIRFERKVSARTRILVVTEGLLARMIQEDPMLESVGAIVFDEFHERHLSADLGLALALDVQSGLREDLRIVLMSATLDGEALSTWLDAPRISSAGRAYPVEIRHVDAQREEKLPQHIRRALTDATANMAGDALVFLPGKRDIALTQAVLEHAMPDVDIRALHGDLPVEEQAALLSPSAHARRVVLATNVAESSVTLPGVRIVVDSGLARVPAFNSDTGFTHLETRRISQDSADQRAGRAGRVAEGLALRLWPASQRLQSQRTPEILQADLAPLRLELAAWGSDDLRFVTAPPTAAMQNASALLRDLGALDRDQSLSAHGRRLLELGLHPRMGAMVLSAQTPTEGALACDLIALADARSPLLRPGDAFAERWQALAAFRTRAFVDGAHAGALRALVRAAMQWRKRLRVDAPAPNALPAHALGALLAQAYPDRIARASANDPYRYQLANGQTAKLSEYTQLLGEPWLVINELHYARPDARILSAAPVDEAYLREAFSAHFQEGDEVEWDEARAALVAARVKRFARFGLGRARGGHVDAEGAQAALVDAVRRMGLAVLPWSDASRQWQARVQLLRKHLPALALPAMDDDSLVADLDDWLAPAFAGKTRLSALDTQALSNALRTRLDWSQQQALDVHAPRQMQVPSGLSRDIYYALDHEGEPEAPVLAVKLQELFGLGDTPTIADGRVSLTLHLLSPGGRPLQGPRDWRGFWARTYPEVKKDMKGRYPKHPWPDDPWSATATHRAKPRGT